MAVSFKDRVEMLKEAFEKLLVECREIFNYSGNVDAIDSEMREEIIEISKAIESACNKLQGK